MSTSTLEPSARLRPVASILVISVDRAVTLGCLRAFKKPGAGVKRLHPAKGGQLGRMGVLYEQCCSPTSKVGTSIPIRSCLPLKASCISCVNFLNAPFCSLLFFSTIRKRSFIAYSTFLMLHEGNDIQQFFGRRMASRTLPRRMEHGGSALVMHASENLLFSVSHGIISEGLHLILGIVKVLTVRSCILGCKGRRNPCW